MKGSLQVKNNKYYAVFRVNGKQKWIGLKIEAKRGNKREAEKALTNLMAQYNTNPNMFDKCDLVEYINKWLSEVKNQVDTITYEGYSQYTTKHIIPYFESKNIMLQDVKTSDIEAYYSYKSVSGRLDGKPGGLSLRTIKLHGTVINLVFKKAVHDGLIKDNPCQYAKYPRVENNAPYKASFYTISECNKLLEITQNTPLHDMIYITLLYGLRRSELLGLKWDAVDFDNNTVSIKHTRVLNATVVNKDKTKNISSNRIYPLLTDVRNILEKIFKQQEKERLLFGNCYSNTGYIFVRENGIPYHPSYPTHALRKCIEKNDLPSIRWHDLRHSCASILLDKGWSMKAISEWLGHSNISITMDIYTHINIEQKRILGDGLNGMLNN